MFTYPLKDALADFMRVLESARATSRLDYSTFWAIINSCSLLSYETLDVDESVIEQIQSVIDEYRKILPGGGSGYHKVRRSRLNLSRAEALIMMRTGREQGALSRLQRATEGLKPRYPDDSMDAHTDLMCLLTKLEMEREAAHVAQSAAELLDRVTYRVPPMGRNALLTVSRKERVSYGEAIEVRIMIRPQELTVCGGGVERSRFSSNLGVGGGVVPVG